MATFPVVDMVADFTPSFSPSLLLPVRHLLEANLLSKRE